MKTKISLIPVMVFLFFSLPSCSNVEFAPPQVNEGEFLLEVDYSKTISETIGKCQFGLIDERIGDNFIISPENSGKKVSVVAAIISFNKASLSDEAKDLLKQDGRYRGANFSELLALSLKFPHPYFDSNPIITDFSNGWSLLNFNASGNGHQYTFTIAALNAGFRDYKSLPGYSPWMTAYIYDRDIRTLELKQEFKRSEINNDWRFYPSSPFLVIRIKN